MAGQRTVRLVISGRVQGVWYRGWTVETAKSLGLDGWVRNRRDGTVEALVSGEPEAVRQMLDACREGPPAAQVEDIEVGEAQQPDHSGFRQLPTE